MIVHRARGVRCQQRQLRRTKDVTTELANAKTGQHALAWRELVELGIAQSFSAEGATGESGRCRLVWPKGHTLGDVVGTGPGGAREQLGARQLPSPSRISRRALRTGTTRREFQSRQLLTMPNGNSSERHTRSSGNGAP